MPRIVHRSTIMNFARTAVFSVLTSVLVAGAVQAQIVKLDSSSTVYPISEAVAEEFQKAKKNAIKVTVGISGTGGTGGTGLGLAIVKHVLARHQGTLTIHSEIGRGSVFSARLPR